MSCRAGRLRAFAGVSAALTLALASLGGAVMAAAAVPKTKIVCITQKATGQRTCYKYTLVVARKGAMPTWERTHRCDSHGKHCVRLKTVASSGVDCSHPQFKYTIDSARPGSNLSNNSGAIQYRVDKHRPVPAGFTAAWRISVHGKHGARICAGSFIKFTGQSFNLRCSLGPCAPPIVTFAGNEDIDIFLTSASILGRFTGHVVAAR